jgi:DNA polymerase I-like protein with 3'-5' exonuclease and polymerase domains
MVRLYWYDPYPRRVVEECRKRRPPYVETLGGRRRYLEAIARPDQGGLRAKAERQAINTMCQVCQCIHTSFHTSWH